MPRRVAPKSELAFRAAKARARPYLLTDGNGLSMRVHPSGSKTWLLRYRRLGTGKENFFRRDFLRRNAGSLDHQLLLAATLERNKPERCGVDAVTARSQQAVILLDGRLIGFVQ